MSIQTLPISTGPLNWLRQIPGDLFRLDEKPLLGFPPPFAWDDFADQIATSLQLEGFSIHPSACQWRPNTELFSGLGTPLAWLEIALTPLEGSVWWAMPEAELKELVNLLFIKEPTANNLAIDHDFLITLHRFLAVQVLNSFKAVTTDNELSPLLKQDETIPNGSCLTIDVAINFGSNQVHGRLFLSPEFRKSWAQHYQAKDLPLNNPIAESLDAIIHLEIGRITLRSSEWKSVSTGDFIVFDRSSIKETLHEDETVMLVISGTPFFKANLNHGSLTILEHPLYYEVNKMTDQPSDQESENNKILPDGADDSEFDFDDYLQDDLSELSKELKEHADEITPDADVETDLEEDQLIKPSDEELEEQSDKETALIDLPQSDENIPPEHLEDIPLPIIVEIGRIQMSIKKLLDLQPGNMLDLNISAESSVDLIVHNKKIARGELLKIGESLGVRILEIY